MMYSVYNYDTKLYTYYEGSGPKGTHAGAPPASLIKSKYGATIEQSSWKLPGNARKVGQGDLPKGRIATSGVGFSLGDVPSMDPASIAVLGGLAYLAWRYFR
jgi:hypothetical protein